MFYSVTVLESLRMLMDLRLLILLLTLFNYYALFDAVLAVLAELR